MHQVTTGMTKRQVKRLLGKPTDKTNLREHLGLYGTVGGLSLFGRLGAARHESWLYADVPEQGCKTLISFMSKHVNGVNFVERRG
jgi:hypothetical protein